MNFVRRTIAVALAVTMLPALAAPLAAQDASGATGIWQSQTGITRVRVSKCGQGLCGTVVWQKNPSKDVHNPDPAKRDRPIVGLQLVSNMKQVGPNEWSGSIYNYEDGKTYQGKVQLTGARLAIGGCVLGGMICQTRTWTKIQ
jgi:uncharacterized protein (DUF2147 family)